MIDSIDNIDWEKLMEEAADSLPSVLPPPPESIANIAPTEPKCECGSYKTWGTPKGAVGHASYCAWSK